MKNERNLGTGDDRSVASVLDTFGLLCPMPIIKTAARIKEMQPGQVLKILSDDPGIKEDLPAWCLSSGHELIRIDESNGEFQAYIRKKK